MNNPVKSAEFRRTVEWYTVTSVTVATGVRNDITYKIHKLFFFFSSRREFQSEKKRFACSLTLLYQPHMNSCCFLSLSLSLSLSFLIHVWSWYFSLLIKQVYILPKILLNAIKHNKDNCTIVFQRIQRKNVWMCFQWWWEMKKLYKE